MKGQLPGPQHFRGMNMTEEEFEYLLGKMGAVNTDIKSDPKPKVKDVMFSSLRNGANDEDNSDDGNDW